ncbi:hypothetical protein ES703_86795 [subsurface metagenome]
MRLIEIHRLLSRDLQVKNNIRITFCHALVEVVLIPDDRGVTVEVKWDITLFGQPDCFQGHFLWSVSSTPQVTPIPFHLRLELVKV